MNSIEQVISFSREYVNKPATRTPERKALIRDAIKKLTGRNLGSSCATCYIEAVFEIIKFTKMASSKYELKKGVVLQAFGRPEKTCTNNTITDALGDWYMEHYPEKRIYFARYPKPEMPIIPQGVTVLGGAKEVVVPPTAEEIIETEIKPKEVKTKPARKPARTKKTE